MRTFIRKNFLINNFPGQEEAVCCCCCCCCFFEVIYTEKPARGDSKRLTKNVLTVLSLGTCLFNLLYLFVSFQLSNVCYTEELQFSHSKFQFRKPKTQCRQPIQAATFRKTAEPRQLSKTDSLITLVSHIRRVVGL